MELLSKGHLIQFIPISKASCDNRSFKTLTTGTACSSNILYRHSQTVLKWLGHWNWRAEPLTQVKSWEYIENLCQVCCVIWEEGGINDGGLAHIFSTPTCVLGERRSISLSKDAQLVPEIWLRSSWKRCLLWKEYWIQCVSGPGNFLFNSSITNIQEELQHGVCLSKMYSPATISRILPQPVGPMMSGMTPLPGGGSWCHRCF